MNKLEEALNDNDSTKRMLYTAVTGVLVPVLAKYGISENLILAFITFMGTVIAGSNYHAAAKAKGEAAAAVIVNGADAAAALGGKVVP